MVCSSNISFGFSQFPNNLHLCNNISPLMGDHHPTRSQSTTDLYKILGIPIKDIYKGFMKWNPTEKSPKNKTIEGGEKTSGSSRGPEKSHGREEQFIISAPTSPLGFDHRRSVDDSFFANPSIIVSTSQNRRCKTPSPSPRSMSRNMSRRSTTPTSLSRNKSRRSNSDTDFITESVTRNLSRKLETPESNETPVSLSKETSRNHPSEANSNSGARSLSRNVSKIRSATPIIYSQSTALKKPPPREMKLECSLEELCEGCVKKIMITRDAIVNGIIVREEEMLKIEVKPGWKKGTKITFEGKGDEKPGYLPADIIFLIEERRHPLFSRDGDDLEIGVEIPLVSALTGCSITVPLLGGDKMSLSFDNIIYPGFEKVIRGQGMPNPKHHGRRGDLRIQFLVEFPTHLSHEQRAEAVTILQHCS